MELVSILHPIMLLPQMLVARPGSTLLVKHALITMPSIQLEYALPFQINARHILDSVAPAATMGMLWSMAHASSHLKTMSSRLMQAAQSGIGIVKNASPARLTGTL
jgi:hypothetical protein